MSRVRIGARKSPLAMAQAAWIAQLFKKNGPRGTEVELVGIVTEGDRVAARKGLPSSKWGGKGLFVKALDTALLKHKIDLAIHSAKDVPGKLTEGLSAAAIPAREDPADLLVSRSGWTLESLPKGARVGTSSLRRSSQLLFIRPDVEIVPIRGNVETRLAKVGECDAVMLAAAGINRLGGARAVMNPRDLHAVRLDPREFLPAPGQGAIMAVARLGDEDGFGFLQDPQAAAAVILERSLVDHLGADCNWPLGARSEKSSNGEWCLEAAIFSIEGKLRVRDSVSGSPDETLARRLADRLLKKGGEKILEWNRRRMGP